MNKYNPIVKLPQHEVNSIYEVLPFTQVIGWHLKKMGLLPIHDRGITGKDVRIAVIDSGVCPDHPDLRDNLEVCTYINSLGNKNGYDRQGHGTHCAGIIGAVNNGTGVVGVAPDARIISIKALSDQGFGDMHTTAQAILKAIDLGVDIISLSLGSMSHNSFLAEAVSTAARKGILIVAAAGNEGELKRVCFPARYDQAIAVGAVGRDYDRVSEYSNSSPDIDIVAAGDEIISTYLQGRYATLTGTSMATPVVAGVLALMLQEGIPVKEMYLSAIDLYKSGKDVRSGYGIINPKGIFGSVDHKSTDKDKGFISRVLSYYKGFFD